MDDKEQATTGVLAPSEQFNALRRIIKADAAICKDQITRTKARIFASGAAPGEDGGETIANLTLAYRHLEDASMRLGKAIQSYDGGVSVYDRASTVGA